MMLVLISMVTLVIMTTAFVVSRGDAPLIAENATKALEAEAAADTAADVAVAALQVDEKLTPAQIQNIITGLDVYGYSGSVRVTDIQGNAPSGGEETLIVTSQAKVGKRKARSQKIAHFDPMADDQVDISGFDWLADELALFATQSLEISGGAMVTRWEVSPRSPLGLPLRVGCNNTSSGCITIDADSGVAGGYAFVPSGASATAIDDASPYDTLNPRDLPSGVPVLGISMPDTDSLPWNKDGYMTIDGENVNFAGNTKLFGMDIRNGSKLELEGNITVAVLGYLSMSGSEIKITGNVTLVVPGSINITDNSVIELTEGSSLKIYVSGNLDISNHSSIGFPADMAALNPTFEIKDYYDPRAVHIYGGDTFFFDNFDISDRSSVCGVIHTPEHDVKIDDESAVFGSVLARRVKMKGLSRLYYDHVLDPGYGYTVTDGPLYENDDLIDGLADAVTSGDTDSAYAVVTHTDVAHGQVGGADAGDGDGSGSGSGNNSQRFSLRCQAFRRPAKAWKYEGKDVAVAEDEVIID